MLQTPVLLVQRDHWDPQELKAFPVQLHGQVQLEILGPMVKVTRVTQGKLVTRGKLDLRVQLVRQE